ncbi:TPR repeat protein [Halalkalibacter akibai JCM 9157]|uniref:TPR repeat protein n=2 Tax=Halalkalibacter akibai TaxID=1411 RepID=W4QR46_HALA3|nr:TPR repeat protein [Halalkalibacter akibai JCM 9157]
MDANALFGYGFTAYQMGDMILAIEQLEALLALDPDYSSLYPYLAKAYEAEGRFDDALEILEKGIKVDEYNEQLYVLAGKLSFKRQRPNEGERFLRQVIALNPSNVEAVQTLAAYFKHVEMYDELLELMSHVKEMGEEDPIYTWYEATALRENDDFDKALKCYREIEVGYEHDVDFLEEYGYFLLEFGKREEAKLKFQQVLLLQPENTGVSELLQNLD